MRYLSALILVLLMLPTTVQACWVPHDISETKDYVCPIDEVKILHIDYSIGGAFGQTLDLQPIGCCMSHPMPMAQCPNDGMIIYKDNFTPEEVVILKDYVHTDEYQQMVKDDTTYWLAARLKEKLGVPLNERWYTMLQATWEADSKIWQASSKTLQPCSDKYESYAHKTINAIEALLADLPKDTTKKDCEIWQLLLGDLFRRVGDFDKAEAYFNDLLAKPAFKDHDSHLMVINYELELIAKKDQTSHKRPESESTR